MNKAYKKPFWQTTGLIVILAVVAAGVIALRTPAIQDVLAGMGYEPEIGMAEIRDELELTSEGRRLFAATRPSLENKESFNTHCTTNNKDVSLLGCYTGGRIYVYEITDEKLKMANKVTAAHEILHAAWERLSEGERVKVAGLLDELYEEKRAWFDEELEAYAETERTEEMWTRAGTKLGELPEELEEYYARYFNNRRKIVQWYDDYEAPFLELKLELEQLAAEIERVRQEIEAERTSYLGAVAALDARIERFNICAEQAGCFASQSAFEGQRSELLVEKETLDGVREKLNEKITKNNERIEDYQTRQMVLGELNDAMDSRMKEMEVLGE